MSISGISGSTWSIREAFQQMRSNGGISKDDLTQLANKLTNSDVQSGINSVVDSFDTIDTDSNGLLDGSEMATYSKKKGASASRQGPPPGGAPALTQDELSQMAEETGDDSLAATAESFDEADTDEDGKVSHAEYLAFAKANGLDVSSDPGAEEAQEMTKEELQAIADEKSTSGTDDTLLTGLLSSFDDADTDGNGAISQPEFEAYADTQGVQGSPPPRGPKPPKEEEEEADSTDDESVTSVETESSSISSAALQAILQAYMSNGNSTEASEWLLQAVQA